MMNTIRLRAIFLIFTLLAISLAVAVSNILDCDCHQVNGVADTDANATTVSVNAKSQWPRRIDS